MSLAMTSIAGQFVVITGASSGLGRAAAIEFAHAGATVVLAARRADALEQTARSCHGSAEQVFVVVTDVTIEDSVQRLVGRTLDRYGRIDVWINNAGVSSFGLFENTPFEPHQRVFETNVYGAIRALWLMFGRSSATRVRATVPDAGY